MMSSETIQDPKSTIQKRKMRLQGVFDIEMVLSCSKRKRRRTGIWKRIFRVRKRINSEFLCLEAEEEAEDTNVRTYENAVTLYEDKQYYPDAEDVSEGIDSKKQVFKGAEVVVQEEDTQDIKEPLIKPLSHQTFSILEKNIPETKVD